MSNPTEQDGAMLEARRLLKDVIFVGPDYQEQTHVVIAQAIRDAEQRGFVRGVDAAGLVTAKLIDMAEGSGSKGTASLIYHDLLLPIQALKKEQS
jgi:hypothetical protein